ncbi:Transposable element Tcb1 transposase [Trichoplax sp. H2]|nr:Transposable element Tcb1 transposase [Trichoplax sp. H2]|eukprot:RDD37108.1 Transposable element Tcb1 transposase [Trichoplax sp. H2]
MGRTSRDLTCCERGQIVAYDKAKWTHGMIAKELQISKRTVQRVLKRFCKEGNWKSKKRNSGGHKVTTPEDVKFILDVIAKSPFKTCKEIASDLYEKTGKYINPSTIGNRLIENNLSARAPAVKPLLTEKARKQRLEWCKQYQGVDPEIWQRVLFSDESTFLQFRPLGQYVRRPRGTRYEYRY